MNVKQKTLELIALGINGKTDDNAKSYNQTALEKLYKLANKLDVCPIVAFALDNGDKIEENSILNKFLAKQFQAVKRYENFLHETQVLRQAFTKAKIPFILLKGAVMRDYYLKPWMRTACDIDVLIKENDLKTAQNILISEYGFTYLTKGRHDTTLESKGGVKVELHVKMVESGRANSSSLVLQKVWDYAENQNGGYEYKLLDSMFYFYHVAHMAKHFECGGPGFRPFIDLVILDNLKEKDQTKRDELLKSGGLIEFNKQMLNVCKVWFNGKEHSEITKNVEDYVFSGGAYGNLRSAVAVKKAKKGGSLKYLLSRIFLPYDALKEYYPILEKHKALIGFYQVKRWFRLLKKENRQNAKREIRATGRASSEDAQKLNRLFKDVGL